MSETPTADGEPHTCEVTSDDLNDAYNVTQEYDLSSYGTQEYDLSSWNCSRPVWDNDRCVWHADATDKPTEKLAATIEDGELHGAQLSGVSLRSWSDLSGTGLIGADLSDANLRDADLSDAYLMGADLSGANLRNADLPDAYLLRADLENATLFDADLENATLFDADLENATLFDADLENATLSDADLIDADLRETDLSNEDLSGVNLSRADLRGVSMVGMSADQSTTVGKMCTGLSNPKEYSELAQGYHELKQALSEEGLSQRARQARALEQQARTAESGGRFKRIIVPERAAESWAGIKRVVSTVRSEVRQYVSPLWPGPEIRTQFFTWVGGILSRYLTGYGTRPLYVILWTAAIVSITTAIFALGPAPPDGGWQGGPLYYSVVTFVTAPPHPPRGVGTVTQAAVLLETYLGTALIVLLGYVLGTRERV